MLLAQPFELFPGLAVGQTQDCVCAATCELVALGQDGMDVSPGYGDQMSP